MSAQQKYSICLGAFAPCADRFVTAGYHQELSLQEMLDMAAAVEESAAVEMDYPFMEPAGTDVGIMRKMLDQAGVKVCGLEIDHYGAPKWQFGALTTEDDKLRREAIEISKNGMDAAVELGADQINLWFGHDGYDYPMEADYPVYWQRTIDGIREIAAHRADVKVCIEYKPKEPRVHSLVSTVGKTLLVANATGMDNVGVNIDTGHALMGFENLADSAMLCQHFNKMFYLHLNDNYREWDHDMIVGSVHVWETLELLYWLNKVGYDGWYSLDIYPYRQDPIAACRESLRNLIKLTAIAESLDEAKLAAMRVEHNVTGTVNYLREMTFK